MMKKLTSTITSLFLIFVLSTAMISINGSVNAQNEISTDITGANETSDVHTDNESSHASIVTRDSQAILLEGKSLPEESYIHLYDTTPYKIVNGHVAAKIPCNDNASSSVNILIGVAPNLTAADMEFVAPLSSPGELCLYHADLVSDESNTITDIAIQNNSTDNIDFPSTSTVVIGVNEISSLGEDHHHGE
jgi:hypothetical protein